MEIELANSEFKTVVDEELYAMLSRYRWRLNNRGYVGRPFLGGFCLMHRQIMWRELERRGLKFVVDHINGDKLDNRRVNLRVGKQGRNIMNNYRPRRDNVSGIVGVYFDVKVKRWKAVCAREYLGSFATKEEAAAVRKKEVEKRGGRHSVLGGGRGVEIKLEGLS